MGTTQPVVARLESPGEERMPNLSTLLKAMHALGIDIFLVNSSEDASQALSEIIQRQRTASWDAYQHTHPEAKYAALVAQTLDGLITLPPDVEVARDTEAPFIKVNLND